MVIENDRIELAKQIKHVSVYPVGGTMSDWVNAGKFNTDAGSKISYNKMGGVS